MARDGQTVTEVVKQGLCTGCGTCASVCPTSAILITIDERKGTYVPELVEEECNQCGICLDSCPGHSSGLDELGLRIFGNEPEDALLGNYMACYLAHATDPEIRYNSASGGLVTSLLIFALDQGLIDGALVTRMKRDSPLEPEPFIARTREEVLQASASKYCPVPANTALREILQRDGKYAVVGLPCHIQGIRKAEAADRVLRDRISLHLGIFCSHTVSFSGTEFLLSKVGIRKEDVAGISYRGSGWPGGVTVKLKNGNTRSTASLRSVWSAIFSGFFYTPSCCLSCKDVANELADISFGDPWLPEIVQTEREGKSAVIARSEQGEALLRAASSKGVVELQQLDSRDVIRSQRLFLHFKKVNIQWRRRWWKLGRAQSDTASSWRLSFYSRLIAAIVLFNSRVSTFRAGGFLLKVAPLWVLRRYVNCFYALYCRVIDRELNRFG